jgi:integrase
MAQGRITKRTVDALSCPQGKDRVFLWDDALSGFGIAAHRSGKKTYAVQYRQDGRSRRATIGEHGRLTPDKARSEAKKLLAAVESGSDPVAEREAARKARTFGEIAEEFLKLHVATKRKARTGSEYRRMLLLHIIPAIGSKRIVDIRRADAARLHGSLVKAPYEANRCLAVVSSIWAWAARRDETGEARNPCKGVERYPEKGRERFLTNEELGRLGDALTSFEASGGCPFAAAAIRLLALTGARLREVLDARWSEVDLGRGMIFLPDSKTGHKPLYLSAAAQAVLAGLPRHEQNPHIIPGRGPKAKSALVKPWAFVRRAAGLPGVRLHDLRHSFASVGAGASMGLPVIGKLLGHANATTTARYAHLDADPMRRAVETIGTVIDRAMRRRGVQLGKGALERIVTYGPLALAPISLMKPSSDPNT